ncbi:aminoglycoside phosphotransferase family protein [Kitasatospora sp. NBC_00240]|uniref:phosphotransferase n=1 Tax=Kitasatospora sp. NBC_00240 TaxID=2903567 RepID=UPI00224CBBCC|nr:phosphotransferase [Kitasatospora sp. NBC_00240]MCX5214524.1 aminoglycoside phosphotransferase family protein [Kitasatospora sp. NBC_00240]
MTAESGGYVVDVQRTVSPTGRAVRQIHTLHLDDGRIVRHVVHPARPREPADLPAGSVRSLLAGPISEFHHDGLSGASLFRAWLPTGEPVVVKHVRPGQDWMARATHDPGREALLFEDGVLGTLPPPLSSPVIATERVADGWLLVMRDVGEQRNRLRSTAPVPAGEATLAAVHGLHAKFTGIRAGDWLCSTEDRLRLFSPLRPFLELGYSDTLPKTLTRTWETFTELTDPSLSAAVLELVLDPNGLLRALDQAAPGTLLHGDYRPANLGLGENEVFALDWGLACHGPAVLDFVWYLSNAAWGGDDDRNRLGAVWERLTGDSPTGRAMDLAVVFHAVMGEVAFLVAENHHQPPGFPRPSDETAAWWLRRLHDAFERVGDLSRPN